MIAYQVQSTNMDIRDGVFEHGNFFQLKHAMDIIKAYASLHEGKTITEDLDGTLKLFDKRILQYTMWYERPAVYYRSHWGNYRMVIWIREIHIQE
jgi:hypothetical protein